MLGYACINMELREQGIFTNRTLRKATLEEKMSKPFQIIGKLFSTPTPTQAIFEQDLNGRLNCNFVLQNPVLLSRLDF